MNGGGCDRRLIAVCVRHKVAAIVILSACEIIEVARCNLRHCPPSVTLGAYLTRAVCRFANDYDVDVAVAEKGTPAVTWLRRCHLRVVPIAHRTTKERGGVTKVQICQRMIVRHPELRQFVKIGRTTGRIAMSERWRTVVLLAAALGHAAHDHPADGRCLPSSAQFTN